MQNNPDLDEPFELDPDADEDALESSAAEAASGEPTAAAVTPGPREFVVSEDESGQRLDRFIALQIPEISRTHVQTLIDEGRVQVGGIAKKPSHRLEAGESVNIDIPAPELPGVEPENIPLDILYEDEDLVVLNKPSGMIVHPGAGEVRGTLVAALLHRYRADGLSKVGGVIRPGIVHRLDKDTSGVMLVARNDDAHAKLVEEFRERRVEKTYIALLHGAIKGDKGRIELPVARDLNRRSRMTARRASGREARTDWRLRLRLDQYSLIDANLHTGRTHQIRVHFSALAFPVVGDTLYGAPRQERVGKDLLPPLERNFLHSARIALAHPQSGKRMEFRAPLPAQLIDYIHILARAVKVNSSTLDAALKELV
ncbi:MAG TPA: RluA family pseudouridine synthase [Candidatus Acidoferrales bacterium]